MTKRVMQTPMTDRSAVVELGNHLFKKQVLPYATINYQGRDITFDKDYATNLASAYQESAYDSVPFVMADEQNRHTMDPERSRGEITGLSVEDDGLYAYISPTTDEAAEFLRKNPKMGVSVRVVEEMTRADGRSWPVALQHVLGTFDPQLTGMKPWEEVSGISASNEDGEVVDLSGLDFSTKTGGKMAPKQEYSEDELVDLFRQFLMGDEPDPNAPDEEPDEEQEDDEQYEDEGDEEYEDDGPDSVPTPDDEIDLDSLTTEELEELAALLEGDEIDPDFDGADQPAVVAASNESNAQVVELSQAVKRQQSQMQAMQRELDAKNFSSEQEELMKKYGIPPRITNLAKPLLMGRSQTVELSNGTKADPGKIMRDVLMAVGEQVRLLDMDGAIGSSYDSDEADDQGSAESRADLMARIRKQTPGL